MRQKAGPQERSATQVVKDIRRRTRKHHSSEEKIRVIPEGLRGEDNIAEVGRREGIATSPEVRELRAEAVALKEALAEATLENRLRKKEHACGRGRQRMRYLASEKLEIIRLVEGSHLPVKHTLEKLGVPRSTFHRWYGRYQASAKLGWRIDSHIPAASGTGSRMMFGSRFVTCSRGAEALSMRTHSTAH